MLHCGNAKKVPEKVYTSQPYDILMIFSLCGLNLKIMIGFKWVIYNRVTFIECGLGG